MQNSLRSPVSLWGFVLMLALLATPASAQQGSWTITKLPIKNALEPVINNSGEIVWFENSDGGVFSSVRGRLAEDGLFPRLANSGEVVYADWFGGPGFDLVSTTRGRLTFGNIIDVNASRFDVNASGEVVYGARDSNNIMQIFSTVRGQITFDSDYHANPCINDLGEIVWNQFGYLVGNLLVSSTRGVLPVEATTLYDINNAGDYCLMGYLEGPPGNYSAPHLYASTHGFISSDTQWFQWGGSINDAGTIVWHGPEQGGSIDWYVFQAEWISEDTTAPQILGITVTPNILRPAGQRMVPVTLSVEAVDNFDPAPVSRITEVRTLGASRGSGPDWEITGALTVNLRAKPKANYTIVIESRDASGNVSTASVEVKVSPGGK